MVFLIDSKDCIHLDLMLWICFLFAILRLFTASGRDFQTLLHWTQPLHSACISHLREREFHPIYFGLLCGDSALPPETAELFKDTGLYHLLIVSGSHFVFLEQIFNFIFRKNKKVQFVIFILFAAICQFNPPVLRALISLTLQTLSDKHRLFWRREQVALYSGLCCLILFPEWLLSLSLLLSWLASLALTFSRKNFKQHVFIFLLIFPIFYNSSPLSILNNLLVAPLFGFFYFPATVFSALIPYGQYLGNWLWLKTFYLMEYLPSARTGFSGQSLFPLALLWIYTFSLHIAKRLARERHL